MLRIDTTLRVAPTSSEWHRGGAQASFVLVLLSGRSAGLHTERNVLRAETYDKGHDDDLLPLLV